MRRLRAVLSWSLLALFTLAAPAWAEDAPAVGTWRLAYVLPTSSTERPVAVVEITSKGGKLAGRVTAVGTAGVVPTVEDLAVDGKEVRFTLKGATGTQTFEGRLPAQAGDQVLGSFHDGRRIYAAWMSRTDAGQASSVLVARPTASPLQKAASLSSRSMLLRLQAARAQNGEEKKKLLDQAADAEQEAQRELPRLYAEVLEKHANTPAVFEAALRIAREAARTKTSKAAVQAAVEKAEKTASAHGRRWHQEFCTQLAETLGAQADHADLAIPYARKAESTLSDQEPVAQQARVIGVLATALQRAGKRDEARAAEARLAKLEAILDKDYLTRVPPFKPQTFSGRKGQSDRAVVMELFTGAQCPPCVAADVAFDVLAKTYKPSDVILIQYHMHIPGPDPLTNTASEARWNYYREKFPTGIRGTPSTLFNGKPDAGGGGTITMAEKKYEQYRGIIEPLLDRPAGARLEATAKPQGSKIDITVDVSDLAEPGKDKKLRLLLVEETVRYVGGNGLRFHHQVVRAMPGGPDGFALTEKASKRSVSVDLKDVRRDLASYLDDYASRRAFPNSSRPMDLKNLRLIALVQDDSTREILQGLQIELPEPAGD